MVQPLRVDLDGALAGHHVILDADELTFGLVEDFESGRASAILDGLARCIAGGDLPKGTDRNGLRRLKPDEMTSVLKGVGSAFALPKS